MTVNFEDLAREYRDQTRSTAEYPEATQGTLPAITYCALGLANEAGEAAGKVKKLIRGDKPLSPGTRMAIADELGDALWYLTRLADELGYDLDEIILLNLNKVRDRKDRGVIKGDGDDR